MNLLAHFYLSRHSPAMIVGSYLGDFVKGKQYLQYDPALVEGILLHREVDHYTDHHPVFLQSKHRLVSRHGHYAGVIVDIFYDHYLAKNWSDFSPTALDDFAQWVYQCLQQQRANLPEPARQMLYYMSLQNWLVNYANVQHIARTLRGMEKRSRYPNIMGSATEDMRTDYEDYKQEFFAFFAEIQAHVQAWMDSR